MFDIHREVIDWAGRKLVLETGKIARQADGAVLASYGETTVLATVVGAKAPKPGQDFFPLTVNYQEKAFAAGRIPAATSSAKGAHRRRRRWFPVSSTGPSGRCFRKAIATTRRWSSPCWRMTSRTIPTSSPWSPRPPL
jgi:Polyribonucleotide nucleotidyltransferase (polynucleotide phosphorylase)